MLGNFWNVRFFIVFEFFIINCFSEEKSLISFRFREINSKLNLSITCSLVFNHNGYYVPTFSISLPLHNLNPNGNLTSHGYPWNIYTYIFIRNIYIKLYMYLYIYIPVMYFFFVCKHVYEINILNWMEY